MSDFFPLAEALEGWFETAMAELPDELRLRVEEDFLPMPWDRLNAAERREVVRQIDFNADPATESLRQFGMELAELRHQITKRITHWECIPVLNADQLHRQEQTLKELRRELAEIDATDFDAVATELSVGARTEPTPTSNIDNQPEVGSPEWRSNNARKAAESRHGKPGGSKDVQRKMKEIWASGKYTDRDTCAEEECAALGVKFKTARNALVNTPEPPRC